VVPIDNGFPLGLVEQVDYPESKFLLAVGAQLTLITDGVVDSTAPGYYLSNPPKSSLTPPSRLARTMTLRH